MWYFWPLYLSRFVLFVFISSSVWAIFIFIFCLYVFEPQILDEPNQITLDPVTYRTVKTTTKMIDHFFYVFETKCKYIPPLFSFGWLCFQYSFCCSRAHLTPTQLRFLLFTAAKTQVEKPFLYFIRIYIFITSILLYVHINIYFILMCIKAENCEMESHAVFISCTIFFYLKTIY